MEAAKRNSSRQCIIASIGLAVVALTTAVAALTMCIYYDSRLKDLESRQLRMEKILLLAKSEATSVKSDDEMKRYKRETDSDDPEDALSKLSLHEIVSLRGPPGRDGRDGRDGKDCDLSDIERLVTLLSLHTTPNTTSVGTKANKQQPSKIEEDELLQRFNETIGYGLLRGIQSANRKLDQLTQASGQPSSSSGGGSGIGIKGGSTYVRWGRTTCSNSSQMIYEGFAAGQHYTHIGGASNYQCLPKQPEFSSYISGNQFTPIYGAEYETGSHIFPEPMQNKNVPCARCYAAGRSATMMMPARNSCPGGWTKEYDGYLMAGHHSHKRAYAYECVDKNPEALPGFRGNENGALFYFNEVSCSSTGHCPPYIDGAELACVVCTR